MKDCIEYFFEWEGSKRIESFASEYLFHTQVRKYYGSHASFDWFMDFPDTKNSPLFIRFTGKEPVRNLNIADRKFTHHLLKLGARVIFARYNPDTDSFEAAPVTEKVNGLTTPPPDDAAFLIMREAGKTQPDTPKVARNKDNARIKIRQVCEALGTNIVKHLHLQRRFINSVLRPALHRHPSDIDTVCLSGQHLHIIEFKRKFPARNYLTPMEGVTNECIRRSVQE
ncbi:hypothetical protein CS022_18305, partial [Veronia nyctiphanis]